MEPHVLRSTSCLNFVILCLTLFLFSACSFSPTPPPRSTENLCSIFEEKPEWYKEVKKASQKWQVPIPVLMAIMKQESAFRADARPPRTKLLWLFPGPRPSSAYGYCQALDETWEDYCKATGQWSADRDEFSDAVDFVGWYSDISYRKNGIKKNDAYNLYLAYHEGHTGYQRKTYLKKSWLIRIAKKVALIAQQYQRHYQHCEKKLEQGSQSHWFF